MDEAFANPALAGHNRPRNPGVPLAPDWFESVEVNRSAVERRAATFTPAHGQEGMAGGVAAACDHLHRPDYALRRRYARRGAAALR